MSVTIERAPAGTVPHRSRLRLPAVLRAQAFSEPWGSFWRSRLLIWVVGSVGFAVLGANHLIRALADPQHVTTTLGPLGNALVAPAVRWDAIWYLHISTHGYPGLQDTGFFPLYPLLIRLFSWPLGSTIIAGTAISMAASLIGLVVVRRLTVVELGPAAAGTCVTLLAFAPFSFYLSAVYTEGLFLALTAGTFYAARRGRWPLAGLLGALAAMTRVTGTLLIVPVLVLFLYGPRADAEPRQRLRRRDRETSLLQTSGFELWRSRLLPRYPLRPGALWALLIPCGLVAFCTYTAVKGLGFTAPFRAQQIYWLHHFTGPFSGIWQGVTIAWRELTSELQGKTADLYRTPALLNFSVLAVSMVAVVGVFRRLPPAYGVYVLLSLLIPISNPTTGFGDPLQGLARYASMMFPFFMWAGAWSAGRRFRPLLIGVSTLLLIAFTFQFATWHMVGTIPK